LLKCRFNTIKNIDMQWYTWGFRFPKLGYENPY